ncbi:MAG TPA: lipid-binding SYLF domain-containing protein [Desulfuromonadaceae bacterium]
MRTYTRLIVTTLMLVLAFSSVKAYAAKKAEIDRDASAALQNLYDSTPVAKMLAGKARGVLVFPNIVKGGFIVGAQYGDGALRVHGKTTGYYRSVAVSYGLQAGVQAFGYALFFMNDAALAYLKKSEGWEIGVGPSIVVVDMGVAKTLTTTTAKDDIYAFIFDQKGLMAGLGLQGSKITKIEPD